MNLPRVQQLELEIAKASTDRILECLQAHPFDLQVRNCAERYAEQYGRAAEAQDVYSAERRRGFLRLALWIRARLDGVGAVCVVADRREVPA